jgi:tRNA(fMet)-specific endonuclease VapC
MFVLDTNTLIYFFKGPGNIFEHLLSQSSKDNSVLANVLIKLEEATAKSNSFRKRITQLA